MVVKAELINQGQNYSMSLRYGKNKECRELINLREEEYEDVCKLLRLMPLLHHPKSTSCPKGVYLFDLVNRQQVLDIDEPMASDKIALMGVNETAPSEIMEILDIIYDSLQFFQRSKLIVRVNKEKRPLLYSSRTRKEIAKAIKVTVV